MHNVASTLIAAAVLAVAGTASAQDHRIPFGDLALSEPAGAQALDQRIARTAREACRRYSGLDAAHCVRIFRLEALRDLPTTAREDYARARKAQRVVT